MADALAAAHAGASTSVLAVNEVPQLALDLRSRRSILSFPCRGLLPRAASLQRGFLGVNPDSSSKLPVGTARSHRASGTGRAERGEASTVGFRTDFHEHARWASHRVGRQINVEVVLAKVARPRRRGLHFHVGLRACRFVARRSIDG